MTVRAGVHENPWGHIDYAEAVRPLAVLMRRVTPFVLALLLVGCAIFFAVSCKGSSVAFSSDGKVASMNVEVARTPAELEKGLMGRRELAADSGMLFDFSKDTSMSFWMKNTTIPLSIAFIDASGKVVAIKDMKPLDLTPVTSPAPYRYAIEANQGWFASHGIRPGFNATIDI
jgi:uncharacterized membrane protein (UPF0127 family)